MLKQRESRQNERGRESDEVREGGRGEENEEEVMNVGDDGALMNPHIFVQKMEEVGSCKVLHGEV